MYGTIQHSFETDSASLSLFLQICLLACAMGYHVLVPYWRKRKGAAKQRVNENDQKVPYSVIKCNMRQLTMFYFRDSTSGSSQIPSLLNLLMFHAPIFIAKYILIHFICEAQYSHLIIYHFTIVISALSFSHHHSCCGAVV